MFRGAHRRGFLDNSGDAAQQRRMEDRLELRRQRREQGLQKRRKQQVRTTTRTHSLIFFLCTLLHTNLHFQSTCNNFYEEEVTENPDQQVLHTKNMSGKKKYIFSCEWDEVTALDPATKDRLRNLHNMAQLLKTGNLEQKESTVEKIRKLLSIGKHCL